MRTPGPWRIEEDSVGIDVIGKERRIAAMYLNTGHERDDVHLVAAAPDMLPSIA